jgi:hypothetical protein
VRRLNERLVNRLGPQMERVWTCNNAWRRGKLQEGLGSKSAGVDNLEGWEQLVGEVVNNCAAKAPSVFRCGNSPRWISTTGREPRSVVAFQLVPRRES